MDLEQKSSMPFLLADPHCSEGDRGEVLPMEELLIFYAGCNILKRDKNVWLIICGEIL